MFVATFIGLERIMLFVIGAKEIGRRERRQDNRKREE